VDNHFKIIIPFYNVEDWIKKTIRSVKLQDYENFECILIDDISTDKTVQILEREINGDSRFKLIRNQVKKYPLKNINEALSLSAPANENIVVILHGDDWLAKKDVLSTLNSTYNSEECWLTYGSYVEYPSMQRGKFAKKVPDLVIKENIIRQVEWMTSHLQTFKYALWKNIDQDKSFKKDDDGQTCDFMNAWDLAWTYPLFELAGSKSHFISDVLYVYNRDNPLNADKVDHEIQLINERKIRNMERYRPLEKL